MLLREFAGPTIRGELAGGDAKALEQAIYDRLLRSYNKAGQEFVKELGGGKFQARAKWKQDELRRKARAMARSLNGTMEKELARVNALPRGERGPAKRKLLAYKRRQLQGLIDGEARFAAKTDLVAHSGLVDPNKAKVMYFQNNGPRPCPICVRIAAGNPYTVRQATTLGAKAHPNCYCSWDEEWQVDEALLKNVRRQVRDREKRLWDGGAKTPASGAASKTAAALRERKGGWRGKAIEQKRVATLRAKAAARAARSPALRMA